MKELYKMTSQNHTSEPNKNYIDKDFYVMFGQTKIDLHPKSGNQHALFLSDNAEKRDRYISTIFQLFAEKYDSRNLNIYIVDFHNTQLYNTLHQLPHFTGATTSEKEIPLFFEILTQELLHRQKLLSESKKANIFHYIQALYTDDSLEPLPILLIAITDIHLIIQNKNYAAKLNNVIRISRCLGIHFLITGSNSNKIEALNYTIPFQINLDCDELSAMYQTKQYLPNETGAHTPENSMQKKWYIRTNSGEIKCLELICGDMCVIQKQCDVAVCSAFKNDYTPIPGTLLHSLEKKGIRVETLSTKPELDLRTIGCWLSKETGTRFRRIACVELLDPNTTLDDNDINLLLKKTFSTLRYLLEQAQITGIATETVALPILGAGNQGIEPVYILSTLAIQCHSMLQTNAGIKKITIYEKDSNKFKTAEQIIDNVFSIQPSPQQPKVFLSYSSNQIDIAKEIRERIEKNNIPCWMAPYSIPAGSNYIELIPAALSQIDILVLVLTPEVEQSRWVQKEVGTAIGSNKVLIPYQVIDFNLSKKTRFLLDGEQILVDYLFFQDHKHRSLINRIEAILNSMLS